MGGITCALDLCIRGRDFRQFAGANQGTDGVGKQDTQFVSHYLFTRRQKGWAF
jgi:hypothetical protein